MKLRNQALDYFQPGWPCENRIARFELANLELYFVFFGFPNIRRVGYHEVESAGIENLQQIGLVEMNRVFKSVMSRLSMSHIERGAPNVGGVDFCAREFFGERQRNAA